MTPSSKYICIHTDIFLMNTLCQELQQEIEKWSLLQR